MELALRQLNAVVTNTKRCMDVQAEDRTHRIQVGQTRLVTVYHLYTRGTICNLKDRAFCGRT